MPSRAQTRPRTPSPPAVHRSAGMRGRHRAARQPSATVPPVEATITSFSIVASHELSSAGALGAVVMIVGAGVPAPTTGERIAPRRRRSKKPVFDPVTRRLYFGGVLVKTLRRDAKSQEVVLKVFTEENWPGWIADPFPPDDNVDSHDRLYNAVKRLNAQRHALIKFSCDRRGTGITWEPRC